MHVICRTKSSNQNLRNIIRQNQENRMLFGPKLKVKTSTKKESKTRWKKKISSKAEGVLSSESTGGGDDVFVQIENEIISDGSDWDPYIPDESIIKDSIINSENLDIANPRHGADTSERTVIANKNILKSSKSKKSKNKFIPTNSEENLPDVPVIDGILNVSVYPDRTSDEDQLQTFRSHVERFSLRSLPSVSAILNKTQSELSRFFLERWKQQMVKKLGEDGFKKYQEEMLYNGINLHANIQQFLSGYRDIQIQPNVEGYWHSLEGVLSKVGEVSACEDSVSHEGLMYKGKFDCVAIYRDCLCVIDWKTSQKPKPLLSNTFDSPIQVAAYLGAINSSAQLEFGPVTNAAIVIAYPWGEPAHVHLMEQKVCEQYWSKWLQRLHLYWKMMSKERQIV
ncbi:uncharacterized protein LOC121370598 [Gigantopelta aegis]|uniref:uncharacterized protein LOC121370598 n=1 Tax=Gigantopelta aegis TaxID=1735272 RepID=UPI001B88DE13|nr:uncharacterized protein LOC121370598 [Gigantopelta aegis]